MAGPLQGIRVLDLSRVLAGPSATQILGDLGADVVKVEKPGEGDDTRKWGPPFLKNPDGSDSAESAYYLSANRNKRSIAVDMATPEGQATLRALAAKADIVVENFKVGGLAKYGLDYASLRALNPGLIYCSLTGFGQTGPEADRPGYDYMIQAMGGIMSLTGVADGEPMKVGVAVADLMAGMYAVTGILAALHHRTQTGEGQQVDIALFDTQLAWLSNAGQYYLTGGKVTPRMGNAHPTIVPYQVFQAKDGYFVLACGNDRQFESFCKLAGRDWHTDPRYTKNADRVRARAELVPAIAAIIATRPAAYWLEGLDKGGVPCAPINSIDAAFAEPQAAAREMVIQMAHPLQEGPIKLIGSPLKLSATPVEYRHAPPVCGADGAAVLRDWLGEG